MLAPILNYLGALPPSPHSSDAYACRINSESHRRILLIDCSTICMSPDILLHKTIRVCSLHDQNSFLCEGYSLLPPKIVFNASTI